MRGHSEPCLLKTLLACHHFGAATVQAVLHVSAALKRVVCL